MTKIIAELCQNHNGDITILEEMVHAASDAGCDFVKIQSMLANDLSHRERFDNGIVDESGEIRTIKRPYKEEYERLKKLDIDDKNHYLFLEFCKKYKIKPMTTIFSRYRLKFLESLDFQVIKVSSFDCSSHKMIEELSNSKFSEIIISTGCTFNEEIVKTVNILKNKNLTLLHCVSIYPTPLNEINLERINFLKTLCSQVGFSEHTESEKHSIKASICALLYDIKYIERHFTILKKKNTKDGPVSLDTKQMKDLVKFSKLSKIEVEDYVKKNIPEFDLMKGLAQRNLSKIEILNRDYYRGRFISRSKKDGEYIYNWEDKPIN